MVKYDAFPDEAIKQLYIIIEQKGVQEETRKILIFLKSNGNEKMVLQKDAAAVLAPLSRSTAIKFIEHLENIGAIEMDKIAQINSYKITPIGLKLLQYYPKEKKLINGRSKKTCKIV